MDWLFFGGGGVWMNVQLCSSPSAFWNVTAQPAVHRPAEKLFQSHINFVSGFILKALRMYMVLKVAVALTVFFWLQFFFKVFLVLVQGTSLIQRLMCVAYTYDNLAPRYNNLFLISLVRFIVYIFALKHHTERDDFPLSESIEEYKTVSWRSDVRRAILVRLLRN